MKKLITLCFFAFALLFSTQSFDAQNKKANAVANEKAKEMGQTLKLYKDQVEEVYQAYKVYETSYQALSKNEDVNQIEIKKMNIALDNKLKEILNDEQFEKYISVYRAN